MALQWRLGFGVGGGGGYSKQMIFGLR